MKHDNQNQTIGCGCDDHTTPTAPEPHPHLPLSTPTSAHNSGPTFGEPSPSRYPSPSSGGPTDAYSSGPTSGEPSPVRYSSPSSGGPTHAYSSGPTFGEPSPGHFSGPSSGGPTDAYSSGPTFGEPSPVRYSSPSSGGPADASSSRSTFGEPSPGSTSRRRFLRTATGLTIGAPTLLAAACGSSSSAKPSGQKFSGQTGTPSTTAPSASPNAAGSTSAASSSSSSSSANGRPPGPETADAALLASKYHGLKPFAPAPPPPATKPVNTNVPLPPVIDHIPTDQKICFLTIDDGAEKDPAFIDMVKDFRIPFTMFLAETFIHTDYEYFAKLRDTGYCTIQNHTLTHPNLVTLTAQRQLAEITGQQQKLQKVYNTTPYLFRAPFGNSNKATQEACKQNNLKAICYWRASFQKQGFQWQAADKKLRPGDILLAHFRGPKANGAGWPEMHELMTNLFHIVQDQGYTFARLEDYV